MNKAVFFVMILTTGIILSSCNIFIDFLGGSTPSYSDVKSISINQNSGLYDIGSTFSADIEWENGATTHNVTWHSGNTSVISRNGVVVGGGVATLYASYDGNYSQQITVDVNLLEGDVWTYNSSVGNVKIRFNAASATTGTFTIVASGIAIPSVSGTFSNNNSNVTIRDSNNLDLNPSDRRYSDNVLVIFVPNLGSKTFYKD